MATDAHDPSNKTLHPDRRRQSITIAVTVAIVLCAALTIVVSIGARSAFPAVMLDAMCQVNSDHEDCAGWANTVVRPPTWRDVRECRDRSRGSDEVIYSRVYDCLVERGLGPGELP